MLVSTYHGGFMVHYNQPIEEEEVSTLTVCLDERVSPAAPGRAIGRFVAVVLLAVPLWWGAGVDALAQDNAGVATDRAALVALYNATAGESWTKNTNWLTDAPLEDWHGVGTNEQGRVASLSLNHNGLTGSIPPELANLTDLTELFLWGNRLSGPVPASLANIRASCEKRVRPSFCLRPRGRARVSGRDAAFAG